MPYVGSIRTLAKSDLFNALVNRSGDEPTGFPLISYIVEIIFPILIKDGLASGQPINDRKPRYRKMIFSYFSHSVNLHIRYCILGCSESYTICMVNKF